MANSKWWSLENIFNAIFNDSANTIKADISGTPIAVPMDLQAVLRQEAITNCTTNLAASGVYTSPAIDASNFKTLAVIMFSDQAYSWRIEHSYDGNNWYWGANNTNTANAAYRVTETIYAKYVRFIFTNTGTATTTKLFINANLFPS